MTNYARQAEAKSLQLSRKSAAEGKRAAGALKAALSKARSRSRSNSAGRASKNAGSWKGKTPTLLYKKHKGGRAGDKYAHKKADFHFTNMLGQNPNDRRAEFDLDQQRHPRCKDLFVHCSLSLVAGKKLTDEDWRRVAEKFLIKIDAPGCAYSAAVHRDSNNEHLHIIFSRGRPDGRIVNLGWDYFRFREAAHQVSDEMLGGRVTMRETNTPQPESPPPASDRHENALRRARRRQTTPNHVDPQRVRKALSKSRTGTVAEFAAHLAAEGYELDVSKSEDGKARGILFRQKGAEEWLAGTSIDRNLSLGKVLKSIQEQSKYQSQTINQEAFKQAQQQRNSTPAQTPIHNRQRG